MSNKKPKNWGGTREAAFTNAEVFKIRRLHKAKTKPAEIARQLKARYDTTVRVIKGLSYKHLIGKDPAAKKKPAKTAKKKLPSLASTAAALRSSPAPILSKTVAAGA